MPGPESATTSIAMVPSRTPRSTRPASGVYRMALSIRFLRAIPRSASLMATVVSPSPRCQYRCTWLRPKASGLEDPKQDGAQPQRAGVVPTDCTLA
jgi:hypothetical protein